MSHTNMPSESGKTAEQVEASLANRDPITGAPGAHPIGTGLGSASGAVAGAAAGTMVAGPAGTLVGAVIGAVAGGLVGKSVGESVNPTEEEVYWRSRFSDEPYYVAGRAYDEYAPAYRTGYEARAAHDGLTFEQAEADMQIRYNGYRGASMLDWAQARAASRAAWNRAARESAA